MNTQPMTPESLAASVIAVPAVARDSDYRWNRVENDRIIKHLEAGGVSTLLYGGNAALAHVALSEYAALLDMLVESASRQTIVVPSVGPHYGMMMDQANILRDYAFPTVMLLPSSEAMSPAGLATGIRRFVDRLGRPLVLYIKHEGLVDVGTVQQLMGDGLLSWIKYAVVRNDPLQDPCCRRSGDRISRPPSASASSSPRWSRCVTGSARYACFTRPSSSPESRTTDPSPRSGRPSPRPMSRSSNKRCGNC